MNQLFALLLLFARSLPALLKSTFNTGTKKIDRVEMCIMLRALHKNYRMKYTSLSLLPGQQDREQDWDYL
jgi:hypothetical protein